MNNKIGKSKLYILIALLVVSSSLAFFSIKINRNSSVVINASYAASKDSSVDLEIGEAIEFYINIDYKLNKNKYEALGIFFDNYHSENGQGELVEADSFRNRDFAGVALFIEDKHGAKVPLPIQGKPAIRLSDTHGSEDIKIYAVLGKKSNPSEYEFSSIRILPYSKLLDWDYEWIDNPLHLNVES